MPQSQQQLLKQNNLRVKNEEKSQQMQVFLDMANRSAMSSLVVIFGKFSWLVGKFHWIPGIQLLSEGLFGVFYFQKLWRSHKPTWLKSLLSVIRLAYLSLVGAALVGGIIVTGWFLSPFLFTGAVGVFALASVWGLYEASKKYFAGKHARTREAGLSLMSRAVKTVAVLLIAAGVVALFFTPIANIAAVGGLVGVIAAAGAFTFYKRWQQRKWQRQNAFKAIKNGFDPFNTLGMQAKNCNGKAFMANLETQYKTKISSVGTSNLNLKNRYYDAYQMLRKPYARNFYLQLKAIQALASEAAGRSTQETINSVQGCSHGFTRELNKINNLVDQDGNLKQFNPYEVLDVDQGKTIWKMDLWLKYRSMLRKVNRLPVTKENDADKQAQDVVKQRIAAAYTILRSLKINNFYEKNIKLALTQTAAPQEQEAASNNEDEQTETPEITPAQQPQQSQQSGRAKIPIDPGTKALIFFGFWIKPGGKYQPASSIQAQRVPTYSPANSQT